MFVYFSDDGDDWAGVFRVIRFENCVCVCVIRSAGGYRTHAAKSDQDEPVVLPFVSVLSRRTGASCVLISCSVSPGSSFPATCVGFRCLVKCGYI